MRSQTDQENIKNTLLGDAGVALSVNSKRLWRGRYQLNYRLKLSVALSVNSKRLWRTCHKEDDPMTTSRIKREFKEIVAVDRSFRGGVVGASH